MGRSGLAILVFPVVASLWAPAGASAACPGDPNCVDLLESFSGTIDFFATGASFTFIGDPTDDRPGGLLDVAEVQVPQRRIPVRGRLERAFLYFGGSLYFDGDEVETPDMDVEIQVPGSPDFVPVIGEELYESGAIPNFPEVILYTVRADITDLMKETGGEMVGTYRVRGFDADIFEGDLKHTAANASFSIVLIFEEERLPPRRIVLFDGMEQVLGSTVTLDLSGFIVSQVPSGGLTFYAQEGDCHPGPENCADGNNLAGLERINVIGADGSRSMVLSDDFNPPNDVFNRTINTVDPPLTNVPGTDIDTFDITDVLRPGDESVTVEMTAPMPIDGNRGELIGLGYVIVGIDVFAPELREDSRIDIRTARGEQLDAYFPGDPLRVTYALSNTGNLPGTEVSLTTELPDNATAFMVSKVPEETEATVEETGGAAMRGKVTVENIAVRHGEIQGLVMLVETECPLPEGGTFAISGDVSSAREGGSPFTLTASVALLPRSICGPRFFLFGGGGCRTVHGNDDTSLWVGGLLLCGLLFLRRRRGLFGLLSLFALLSFANMSCSSDVGFEPDRPPPDETGFGCPDLPGMVAIPSIAGRAPFCIDRYEAAITDGAATSERFVFPARGVTWEEARAACENAGKRLCSEDEWQTACRGDADLTYPYGDAYEPDTCNGFDATRGDVVETGGMVVGIPAEDGRFTAGGCVSTHGVFDLSGNVWEWNATGYFDDTRRGIAGGGFRANRIGLRCVTDDNHAVPDEANDAFGFRCCKDLPQ